MARLDANPDTRYGPAMSADLLSTPWTRYTVDDFEQAITDPGELMWSGGISVPVRDGTKITRYEPKVGTFFAPAVLDHDRVDPDEDRKRWMTGRLIDKEHTLYQPCLMAEMDTGTISEQLARLSAATADGLPPPTVVLLSGDPRPIPEHPNAAPGKSVHLLWRLVTGEHFDPHLRHDEQARVRLQQAIAHAIDGDPSIVDPCRRMRVGGVVSYQAGPFREHDPTVRPRAQSILQINERVTKAAMLAWSNAYPLPEGKRSKRTRGAPTASQTSDVNFATIHSPEWNATLADLATLVDEADDGKIKLCCPFHEDRTPSAFMARSPASKSVFLHCTVCKETWWDTPAMALALTKDGKPRTNLTNTVRVLSRDTSTSGRLWYNERDRFAMLDDKQLSEDAVSRLRIWCYNQYGFEPSKQTAWDAAVRTANLNPRNPLTDYLDGLTWDRQPRIDRWLARTCDLQHTPLHHAYSRMFLISAVARAYQPGVKVDTVLLLIGAQGCRKSTLFRVLAGDRWARDSELDLHSKDLYMQIARAWIWEIPEMSALSRTEESRVKSILSSSMDTYRAPYEKAVADHPRHTVIACTSNDHTPLRDPTGSRRYWPVRTPCTTAKPIDTDYISTHRDQLWGEAVHAYRNGEPWHLPPDLEEERRAQATAQFMTEDPREGMVLRWLGALDRSTFTLDEVMTQALFIQPSQMVRQRNAVAALLRTVGCVNLGRVGSGTSRAVRWEKPQGS